jgi:hypothetical protein
LLIAIPYLHAAAVRHPTCRIGIETLSVRELDRTVQLESEGLRAKEDKTEQYDRWNDGTQN